MIPTPTRMFFNYYYEFIEQCFWVSQNQNPSNQSSQSERTQTNPVNQWKRQVMTCSWCEARENVCERVTIDLGLTSDWMKKWREFFSQSYAFRPSNENRSKTAIESFLCANCASHFGVKFTTQRIMKPLSFEFPLWYRNFWLPWTKRLGPVD